VITTQNIGEFIAYLYRNRKGVEAPAELVQRWKGLSQGELDQQLTALFAQWQMSAEQADAAKRQWFSSRTNSVRQEANTTNTSAAKGTKLLGRAAFVLALLPLLFVAYKYLAFSNRKWLYSITDNIAVRDENKVIKLYMDLTTPATTKKLPSVQMIRALDNEVYEMVIDSTSKIRKMRKVADPNLSFGDYLTNNYQPLYVNASLVVDNEQEFKNYLNVFKGLSNEEAVPLELKYRKVIVRCLQLDPKMQNLYVTTSCLSQNKYKQLSYYVLQELKKDALYAVITKMSDGKYYKFIGDLRANSFTKPIKVGYSPAPGTDEELLQGDMLFKVTNKGATVALCSCDGKSLPYTSVRDSYGSVSHFELQQLPTSPAEEVIDDLQSAGKQLMDAAKETIVDGVKDLLTN
jgi:hypothetical protein